MHSTIKIARLALLASLVFVGDESTNQDYVAAALHSSGVAQEQGTPKTGQDNSAAASRSGPSVLSKLDRSKIPPYELKMAGGGDATKAPAGLVAILGESRFKHLSHVKAVAFSPDGKLLASAGGDSTVRLWNPATGEEVRCLRGRPMSEYQHVYLSCMAFSGDGKAIAAGGTNHAVIIWDVASGRELRVLKTDSAVGALAFSRDQKLLATGQELDAQIWDLTTGARTHRFAGHAANFQKRFSDDTATVAFTNDTTAVIVGHPDGSIRTWELKSGNLIHQLHEPNNAGILSLTINREGNLLAAGCREKVVHVWEIASGRRLHTLDAHKHYVQAVAFHPNGKTLATGGLDGTIKYWEIKSGELRQTFTGSTHVGVESLAFSADGKTLASAGMAVRLWDADTVKPAFDFRGHVGSATTPTFIGDGGMLATAGNDGTAKVWDLAAKTVHRSLSSSSSMVRALDVTPDGKTLVTLDWAKPVVHLWDLATGRELESFAVEGEISEKLAISPNGRWIAAMCLNRRQGGSAVTVLDLQLRKQHGEFSTPRGGIVFSRDSKQLIVAGERFGPGISECILDIWDLESKRTIAQIGESTGLASVHAVALSPDGRTLALSGSVYGADDKSKLVVLLYDLPTRRPRLVLEHPKTLVYSMDFAPDGRSLATMGWSDAIARVWDPRDGKLRESAQMCAPGAYHLRDVRFAPDSRHFAAALNNGTVYISRIQAPSEKAVVANNIPAEFGKRTASPADLWRQLAGKPAPELTQIKGWAFGKPVRIADLRGKHVLLHFWNFQSEHQVPALMLLHELFGERDLAVVLIYPDFGGTVENARKHLAEEGQRSWYGFEPEFRVAVDGGGKTSIPGTQIATNGATHAAFRIADAHRGRRLEGTTLLIDLGADAREIRAVLGRRLEGTTLLIDPQGEVVKQMYFGAPIDAQKTFENLIGKKSKPPASVERFEQLCALRDGQVLQRVIIPVGQDRHRYFLYTRMWGYGPVRAGLFQFDGRATLMRTSRSEAFTLREVLELAIELKPFEIEGADELLKTQIKGDIVFRKGAKQQARIKALDTILRDELPQPIRLVPRDIDKEVIVARGRWQPPDDGENKMHTIRFAVPIAPQERPSLGTARSVQELIDDLENILKLRLINDATVPKSINARWENHLSAHVEEIRSKSPAGAKKLRSLLDNLTTQTGMTFWVERRKTPVWQVEEQK